MLGATSVSLDRGENMDSHDRSQAPLNLQSVEQAAVAKDKSFMVGPQPFVRVGRRRWLLQVGLSGLAGLSLPMLLKSRADAAAQGQPQRPTSVVQIWLSGGPSQIDTWDPKPEMPT